MKPLRITEHVAYRQPTTYSVYNGRKLVLDKVPLGTALETLLKSKSMDSLAFLFSSKVGGFRVQIADAAIRLYPLDVATDVIKHIKYLAGKRV